MPSDDDSSIPSDDECPKVTYEEEIHQSHTLNALDKNAPQTTLPLPLQRAASTYLLLHDNSSSLGQESCSSPNSSCSSEDNSCSGRGCPTYEEEIDQQLIALWENCCLEEDERVPSLDGIVPTRQLDDDSHSYYDPYDEEEYEAYSCTTDEQPTEYIGNSIIKRIRQRICNKHPELTLHQRIILERGLTPSPTWLHHGNEIEDEIDAESDNIEARILDQHQHLTRHQRRLLYNGVLPTDDWLHTWFSISGEMIEATKGKLKIGVDHINPQFADFIGLDKDGQPISPTWQGWLRFYHDYHTL